jgi:stage II sporulation protein D
VRRFLLSILFFGSLVVQAQQVLVGIFSQQSNTVIHFTATRGSYKIFEDSAELGSIPIEHSLKITLKEKNIHFTINGKYFSAKNISIRGQEYANSFKIVANSVARNYDDHLKLKAFSKSIQIVNDVAVEHYVGGVVESESGYKKAEEYYKLQAILCRTYALKNLHRHEDEGYHLCDAVHCQVYFSKSYKIKAVASAVQATAGLVITDKQLNLIDATFHSNCGGQTCNSEDVWSKPQPYLRSVQDTFCLHTKNAHWKKVMHKDKWNKYLRANGVSQNQDTTINGELYYVCATGRQESVCFPDGKIKAAEIRKAFHLRSAFFEVKAKNDSVYIIGRGYGHGVGMCQEGAMEMAKRGFAYKQIIDFYFQDVLLVNLSTLAFFKED